MRPQLLGEIWKDCARCGFTFPVSALRTSRTGHLICDKCWDEPSGKPDSGD